MAPRPVPVQQSGEPAQNLQETPAEEQSALHRWAQANTSMLTSMAFHLIAIVILGLMVVNTPRNNAVTFTASVAEPPVAPQEIDNPNIQPLPIDSPDEKNEDVFKDSQDALMAMPELPTFETDFPQEAVGSDLVASIGNNFDGVQGLEGLTKRLAGAGAKSGDIQISLMWDNINDLDLHVVPPSGTEIWYRLRRSPCKGELDVDMNAGFNLSNQPVENVYWPEANAPLGAYSVYVNHYISHGAPDPTSYTVAIKVGSEIQTFKGEISTGQPKQLVHQFQWAGRKDKDGQPAKP